MIHLRISWFFSKMEFNRFFVMLVFPLLLLTFQNHQCQGKDVDFTDWWKTFMECFFKIICELGKYALFSNFILKLTNRMQNTANSTACDFFRNIMNLIDKNKYLCKRITL